jgi:hypothetical protein
MGKTVTLTDVQLQRISSLIGEKLQSLGSDYSIGDLSKDQFVERIHIWDDVLSAILKAKAA